MSDYVNPDREQFGKFREMDREGPIHMLNLIKLKDTVQRLHAPTKATTLGVGGVLIASIIYFIAKTGHLSFHELLITLFLFLTAPITANFIANLVDAVCLIKANNWNIAAVRYFFFLVLVTLWFFSSCSCCSYFLSSADVIGHGRARNIK